MSDEPKTPDLNKSDWIDVQFKGRTLSFDETMLSPFLGTDIGQVKTVTVELSPYHQVITRAVVEEFIESKGYKITGRNNWYDYGREEYASENLQIGLKKFKVVPQNGYLFLEKEGAPKFVLRIFGSGDLRYTFCLSWNGEKYTDSQPFLDELRAYANAHNILKGQVITPNCAFVEVSERYRWDSIILSDELSEEIRSNVKLLLDNIGLYRKNNMVFKRGVILKGVPGTGKTTLLKAICNEFKGTSIVWATPGDLTQAYRVKYLGEMVRELSPTILMLEDLDLYASHRERGNGDVLGELMNQLDGLVENQFVIVIATTNRAEEVETAIRNRPGRFDRILDIGLPKKEERERMFASFIAPPVTVKNKEKLCAALAELTDGMTGAHIKELVNLALISAIDEKSLTENDAPVLKVKHFEQNLERARGKKMEPTVGFSRDGAAVASERLLRDIFKDDDDDLPPLDE